MEPSAATWGRSRTTEQTPLLAQHDHDDTTTTPTTPTTPTAPTAPTASTTPAACSLLRTLSGASSRDPAPLWKRRWPSILALGGLCLAAATILLGFLAAAGIDEYAMQAAVFQPTRLALDGLTAHGATVLIEGDFALDASRVHRQSVRTLGRLGTWIARAVETGPADVDVLLPDYANVRLGTAHVPRLQLNIRNGHHNRLSVITTLQPGAPEGIRGVAHEWLQGQLAHLHLTAMAAVPLRVGLINLGHRVVEQSLVLRRSNMPEFPHYNITKLDLREIGHGHQGLGAHASIVVTNDWPVDMTLPAVAVDMLIDGCIPSDRHLVVGRAQTGALRIEPKSDITVDVTATADKLSAPLTQVCPDSTKSPLDTFLGDYVKGQDTSIYLKCCQFPDPVTPSWARDLLQDITVPIPFAGRDMGNAIKNFSLTHVHFALPSPWAEPGTPDASPKISAIVHVDIGLPHEMNFPLSVNYVKADADIFYHGKILGKLRLDKWQKANSTIVSGHGSHGSLLLVESDVQDAPIQIQDDDLFSEVVQALIFGGKPVLMDLQAAVSVRVETPMGQLVVRDVPAQGVVPVKRS